MLRGGTLDLLKPHIMHIKNNYVEMMIKLFSLTMVIFSQCMCQSINSYPLHINNFYVKDISVKSLKMRKGLQQGGYGHEI